MKPKIVLLGGGGHCRSVIDVIEREGSYDIFGIVDTKEKSGTRVLGYPVIGSDDEIPAIIEKCNNFLITVGQIKSPDVRRRLVDATKNLDIHFPVIISPYAYVSACSYIGEGSVIMHDAIINTGCRIGSHCIVNTKALLEHDVSVGNFCHISTASVLNGEVHIGDDTFVGSNTVVNQGVTIPRNVVIGSGSVVTEWNKLEESGMFAGNPLKRIR